MPSIGDGEKLPAEAVYLTVERFVGEGLRSRLGVHSFAAQPRQIEIRVEVAADFADTERGRTGAAAPACRRGRDVGRPPQSELHLAYAHPDLDLAVAMRAEAAVPVRYDDHTMTVALTVPPRGSETVDLIVEPIFDGHRAAAPPPTYEDTDDSAGRARRTLPAEMTRLRSSNLDVAAAWTTAVGDLADLPLGEEPGPSAPMAGLPIYQQIFGRDTLTVSWQALLAGPTMLRDSLRLNAAHVGRRIDDWRDEEPGKLLHQARHGPLSLLDIDPFREYFGDFATGPDFLVFLGQYLAWTGDRDTVGELLPTARRVLEWLKRYGDLDRDGFLEYDTRSSAGVKNQGWKDSDTAIVDEHGNVVPNPIAPSELQGYSTRPSPRRPRLRRRR